MTLKARTQKKVKTVIKQQSGQQTTRKIGLTAHRAHSATIQRSQQYPHLMTPQDVLDLQSTIGNHGVVGLLQRSNQNANIASSGPVVQRTPSVSARALPGKQTDDERRKCWIAASLGILANGKCKFFGGLKYGNMARKSDIAVYTMNKRFGSSVEFYPSAYFSPAALNVLPNALVKLVSINVPKNITHTISAGVIVNRFPMRKFNICG